MSSPWLQSKTPVGPPVAARPTVRQLVFAGVVTGGWSGLLCLVIYLVSSLLGVEFVLRAPREDVEVVMPWAVFLLVPIAFAVLGALLASLARGWRSAGRLVFWVGTLLALGTTVVPLTQPESVTWSTRIILVAMHVITWLLVVPQIARIIGDSEPGASVERGE
jgi:ABC-type Na+ efflux pump permease subunit